MCGSWFALQSGCRNRHAPNLALMAITPRADWKQRNTELLSHCSFSIKDLCIKISVFSDVLKNRWQVSFSYSACHFTEAVENVCDGACAKNAPLFFEDVSDAVPAPSLPQNLVC